MRADRGEAGVEDPLGEARTGQRDRLGGAAPTKSRYEIRWHDPVTDKTITLRISD